jgi:RNA polymerase sigma-70 factor (ECF subfamily)
MSPRPPDTAPLSDAQLLDRHTNGDPQAFNELVRRHRDRLWAVALRTLGDPEEAADAVQDALISAFRKAGSYRGDAAVTTWLHRIVVNACLDRTRRRAARPSVAMGDDVNLDAVAQSRGSIGADSISAADTAMDVMSALTHLPEEQRAALVLVDMMGYGVEDAARILEVASGTVKSRCARGRARLVPHLSHLRNRAPSRRVTSEEGGGEPS